MKTIYFKNGSTTKINVETAKILRQRIIEGSGTFQIFSDEPNSDILLF